MIPKALDNNKQQNCKRSARKLLLDLNFLPPKGRFSILSSGCYTFLCKISYENLVLDQNNVEIL